MSSVNFLLGKTLGKYQVLEHVGHGGMAEVYKGQHVQLDRMVAVKVLHPFLADEEGFVVRFQREARIVATLRHPNIVQVFDFDYNDELNIYYMVMEFIDGPTLKTVLTDGSMPQEDVMRFGAAIADAMAYAHKRGMVHRDIKPANIMFTGDHQPVLTDFGIAKMVTLSGLTASGAMVGTPAYMAPEVGMGKPGTASTDIYSLGVVLYHMVTGKLPFDSESPMGMVMQHINDAPPPPTKINPALSKDLEAVILRALEKQPEARYPSADEMTRELRKLAGIETPQMAISGLPLGDAAALLMRDDTTPPITLTTPALTPPAPTVLRRKKQEEKGKEKAEEEDEDRLVRTWPPAAVTPLSTVLTPEEAPKKKRRRSWAGRLLRAVLTLLLLTVLGAVGWVAFGGYIPPQVQAYLPPLEPYRLDLSRLNLEFLNPVAATPTVAITGAPTPTPTATPEPTATPTPTPTPTPLPTATSTPTVTPLPTLPATPDIALACAYRLKLEQVLFELGDTVSPDTPFIAYVGLRNTGECTWPAGLSLRFVSGEPMGAPNAIPITALAPQEGLQVLVPMRSPQEVGDYEGLWEVEQADGQTIGSAIFIRMTVSDLPTPTPRPTLTAGNGVKPTPLTLPAPTLEAGWTEDVLRGQWQGTVLFQAAGGTGAYRYYQTAVREDTLLPEGRITFEAKRCEPTLLKVWAVSGVDAVSWEGLVEYPAPETCQ